MTLDQLIIPIVVATAPTITAVAALVVAIRNGKKTDDIHLQINSRMDEFMELIKEAAYDKGVKSETDKQKLKSPEDPASPK